MQALSQVDEWVGPHGVPGVGVAVWRGGEIVAEHYVGEARAGVAVTSETLFPLASVTKPVTAATFMALVDEGAVSLDEPVGRLLPEFRAGPAAGAEGVDPSARALAPDDRRPAAPLPRIRFAGGSGSPRVAVPGGATIESVIDQMCRLPLRSAPGDELRYSNAGYGVIARLTRAHLRQPFWQIAQNRVLEPLGIKEIVADPSRSRAGAGRASRRHQPSRDGVRDLQQCVLARSGIAVGRTLRHAARCCPLCRRVSSVR